MEFEEFRRRLKEEMSSDELPDFLAELIIFRQTVGENDETQLDTMIRQVEELLKKTKTIMKRAPPLS